jgi:lipoprotein-anchoring transpeptidase ErfK/SrfK
MLATRRAFLLAAAVLAPARAQAFFWDSEPEPSTVPQPVEAPQTREAWYIGEIPDEPFNIPKVDLALVPPEFRRQLVDYDGPERAGTVVIDTHQRFLFLVREDRTAIRYGIGVGRAGFTWSGIAVIKRKAKWPGWRPTPAMLKRRPDIPRYVEPGSTTRSDAAPYTSTKATGTRSTASTAPTSPGRSAAPIPPAASGF